MRTINGNNKYCEYCQKLTKCRVIESYKARRHGLNRKKHDDKFGVNFSRRILECSSCGIIFSSLELSEVAFDKIVNNYSVYKNKIKAVNEIIGPSKPH